MTTRTFRKCLEAAHEQYSGGTVPDKLLSSICDGNSIEVAVGGDAIFDMIAKAVARAEYEVLIQTFAYESNTPAVTKLRAALETVLQRKKEAIEKTEEAEAPLKVYLLIDERGTLANVAFTGHRPKQWPMDPQSLGLLHEPGFVEVYVDVNHHNSMGGNHGKTVVIDEKTLIITGANFQSSNFGHLPAHDAAYKIYGHVAQAARADFAYMWDKRSNAPEQPLPPSPETEVSHPLAASNSSSNHRVSVLFATRVPQRLRRLRPLTNPQNCVFFTD